MGIRSPQDRHDWFAEDGDRLVRCRETSTGQHHKLGIAETNLACLLGELGATYATLGQPLPIDTVYDPYLGPGAGTVDIRDVRAVEASWSGRLPGVTLVP